MEKVKISVKVSDYLILYIDILGYKDMIKDFHDENQFLSLVEDSVKMAIEDSKIYSNVEYAVFSDNLVFAIKCVDDIEEMKNNLQNILKLACILQITFMRNCMFIRGSLTKGTLYIKNNNFVFGRGLVDAYTLENNYAKYSRVIISNELLDILKEYEIDKNLYFIKSDNDDNFCFVNYLYFYYMLIIGKRYDPKDECFDLVLDGLNHHKFIITRNSEAFGNNKKVLNKYKWSMRYHNAFCIMYGLDKKIRNILFKKEEFADFVPEK